MHVRACAVIARTERNGGTERTPLDDERNGCLPRAHIRSSSFGEGCFLSCLNDIVRSFLLSLTRRHSFGAPATVECLPILSCLRGAANFACRQFCTACKTFSEKAPSNRHSQVLPFFLPPLPLPP